MIPTRMSRLLFPLGATVVTLLGACARYAPQPITPDKTDESLAVPPAAELTRDAAQLAHRRLPAVELDLTKPLTPDAAAVIAVLVHPQLRAVRMQRGLAQAQVIQAGLLPNPQATGALDQPITGDTEAAHIGWSMGLSWEVTGFIAQGAKQRSADATYQAIDLAIAWQEWQVAAAARQAVVRLVGARARLPLALEQEQLALANRDLHLRALASGLVTGDLAGQYETALADARAATLDAAAEVERARLMAVRSLGFPVDHPLPVALDRDPGKVLLSVEDLAQATAELETKRLDLCGLRAGYQAQEESLHAAVLGQFPKITLGITRARDTSALGLLGGSVAIDLPFFDRGQGLIATATADRSRLYAEYAQRVFEARHDLAEAVAEHQAAVARSREAEAAMAYAGAREQALMVATKAGLADSLGVFAARAERVRRATEVALWRQRCGELRIAIEIAAGCLLAPPPAASNSSPSDVEFLP